MWKTPRRGARVRRVGLESGGRSDHARSVENTSALSGRRDMFLDERGTGLRVTWHPERDLVVLSVWQGDGCVGTFRMSVQDIPRLSGLLAAALGDWVDQTGATPGGPGFGGAGADAVGGGATAGVGGAIAAGGGAIARAGGAGGVGRGGAGVSGSAHGATITGEWDVDPGTVGGGLRTGGGSVAGLSVQQRIRLSRPVLRLRGIQRRRRSG